MESFIDSSYIFKSSFLAMQVQTMTISINEIEIIVGLKQWRQNFFPALNIYSFHFKDGSIEILKFQKIEW